MADLTYMSIDPDEMWESIMTAYLEAGGDLLYPGDEKEILLRTVQAVAVNQAARMESALKMSTLRYAEGEYLDVVGENAHCERIEQAYATGRVKIEMNATGSTQVIPAGTRMTADGSVYYETVEAVTANGFAQSLVTRIRCATAGEVGNGLVAGTMLQAEGSFPAIASIMVYEQTAGGTDAEDDENYRERIRLYGMANVTTGPSERYEALALEVSSDILDARAVQAAAGQVLVALVLADDADEDSIIQAVETALSDRTERPLTDYVQVQTAEEVDYTLKVSYYIADNASGDVSGRVVEAVAAYKDWQDNTIGRAFDPDYLIALLYQAGASRISFAEGSSFNGGEVKYTEIEQGQRTKGTITLSQQ